jgi:hypothetical protein
MHRRAGLIYEDFLTTALAARAPCLTLRRLAPADSRNKEPTLTLAHLAAVLGVMMAWAVTLPVTIAIAAGLFYVLA